MDLYGALTSPNHGLMWSTFLLACLDRRKMIESWWPLSVIKELSSETENWIYIKVLTSTYHGLILNTKILDARQIFKIR